MMKLILSAGLGLLLSWAGAIFGATPSSGTISADNPRIEWTGPDTAVPISTGQASCNPEGVLDDVRDNTSCDHFELTVEGPLEGCFILKVTYNFRQGDDWDVELYETPEMGDQTLTDSSATSGNPEIMRVIDPSVDPTIYVASASPFAAIEGYEAVAELISSNGCFAVNFGNVGPFIDAAPPGLGEPDPDFDSYMPALGDTNIGIGAGEPSIGIPHSNNLDLQMSEPLHSRAMYIAFLETLQVTFDDCTSPPTATWLDRSVPTHAETLDPILETDHVTSRTFSSQLAGKTSLLSFSDDDGENWTPSQGAGVNSGVDHQTIGVGPFSDNDLVGPSGAYPNAVYYASQDVAVAQAAISRDGGLTFGAAVPMWNISQCGGLHGHIEVAPNDGTVYVPNGSCLGESGMGVSEDGGATWDVRTVEGTTTGDDPAIGIGSDGTVYFSQCNQAKTPVVAVSQDRGQTWTTPVELGAEFGIEQCVFPAVTAGDGDRAAVFFLGSATIGAGTSSTGTGNFPGLWQGFVAVTYDRGQTWETHLATPPGDPVQKGQICLGGTTCASNRNLLDFNDVQFDEKGRIITAYADGCVGGCVTGGPNSGTDVARITRQQPGMKGLLAAFDEELDPSTPEVPRDPYVEAFNFVDSVDLRWSIPWDGNSDLTSFEVFRREAGGTVFTSIGVTPATQTFFLDDTVNSGTDYCYQVLASNGEGPSSGCFEACAQLPVSTTPCEVPGVARVADSTGEAGTTPALDVDTLHFREPFIGPGADQCDVDSDQVLVFELKVQDGTAAVNGNAWIMIWNRQVLETKPADGQTYDRNMISVRMVGATPQCSFGKITAPSVNQGDDITAIPAENCSLKPDGTITVQVPHEIIDDCEGENCTIGPGYELTGVEVRTFQANASGQPVTGLTANDTANGLSYTVAGNNFCRVDALPVAVDDLAMGGFSPINIDVLANDSANDCDTLEVSVASDGFAGTTTINGDQTITYTADGTACQDTFSYRIIDGRGNFDQARVTVISDEFIFADSFESDGAGPAAGCPVE